MFNVVLFNKVDLIKIFSTFTALVSVYCKLFCRMFQTFHFNVLQLNYSRLVKQYFSNRWTRSHDATALNFCYGGWSHLLLKQCFEMDQIGKQTGKLQTNRRIYAGYETNSQLQMFLNTHSVVQVWGNWCEFTWKSAKGTRKCNLRVGILLGNLPNGRKNV